jgi:hypothetical protein
MFGCLAAVMVDVHCTKRGRMKWLVFDVLYPLYSTASSFPIFSLMLLTIPTFL